MERTNKRKVRTGVVVSNKANKTITVKVGRQYVHPKFGKIIYTSKNYHVHDENNECSIGDTVQIMETRPLSKLKNWRLLKIVERVK